jgi:hypothetical protein
MPLAIRYMKLSDVAPAKVNPKLHDLDLIRESFEQHGFIESLVLDDRTGRLLGGHGRLDELVILRDAGDSPPKNVDADGDEWLVPVQTGVRSKNDRHATRMVLALNRLTEAGGNDPLALAQVLQDLKATPEGLLGTGYNDQTMRDLMASSGLAAAGDGGFLDDILGESRGHAMGSEGGVNETDAVSVTLVFNSTEERDVVVKYLRAQAKQFEVDTIGEAMFALADLERRAK